MQISETSSHHRNDFVWIGKCRHCGATKRYGDGYDDAYYRYHVAPARHCPECGLNCHGVKKPEPEEG